MLRRTWHVFSLSVKALCRKRVGAYLGDRRSQIFISLNVINISFTLLDVVIKDVCHHTQLYVIIINIIIIIYLESLIMQSRSA